MHHWNAAKRVYIQSRKKNAESGRRSRDNFIRLGIHKSDKTKQQVFTAKCYLLQLLLILVYNSFTNMNITCWYITNLLCINYHYKYFHYRFYWCSGYFSQRIRRLNIWSISCVLIWRLETCSVMLILALKPASAIVSSTWDCLQRHRTQIADRAESSVVLTQRQVPFLGQ